MNKVFFAFAFGMLMPGYSQPVLINPGPFVIPSPSYSWNFRWSATPNATQYRLEFDTVKAFTDSSYTVYTTSNIKDIG